jgi:hypothetical protein
MTALADFLRLLCSMAVDTMITVACLAIIGAILSCVRDRYRDRGGRR